MDSGAPVAPSIPADAAAAAPSVPAAAPKRKLCEGCGRPPAICVCQCLPDTGPLHTRTSVLILQHPTEAKKAAISTVPLLKLCLANLQVIVGHRFNVGPAASRVDALLRSRRTLFLFPGPKAISLQPGILDQFDAEDRAAALAQRTPGQADTEPEYVTFVSLCALCFVCCVSQTACALERFHRSPCLFWTALGNRHDS